MAKVAAVVPAAGQSTRMGRPKLVMSWGDGTVIGKVVSTLAQAGKGYGLVSIVVVTGGAREEVEAILRHLDLPLPLNLVHNDKYAEEEMIVSVQTGIASMPDEIDAALIALGDQPQIEKQVVRVILAEYQSSQAPLVAPSYQMHRGHPWLVSRSLWKPVLEIQPPHTLRDFLNCYRSQIHFVVLDTPSILQDLDTPEDYARASPV